MRLWIHIKKEDDKDLRMIRCRLTRIFNPKHNLSNLFLCLFYRSSLTWINPKLNRGLMSGIYPAV